MIDTSDGFAGDLAHICEAGGVGADLVCDSLPLSGQLCGAARLLCREPLEFFLGESDDYELIVTCRPEHVDVLRAEAVARDVPLTEVGRITAYRDITLVLSGGERRPLRPSGWDHFRIERKS
jgi:thiamine-monophosphate kinase